MPCGYVYVDGDSVGELTDEELEKRRILGTEGFVSAFVVVDTDNREVVTGPKIYLNAVAEDESEFDKVRHQIVEQLNDAMMQALATPTSCSRLCVVHSADGSPVSFTVSR